MTHTQIISMLDAWRIRREALDAQLAALRAVLMAAPENPLRDAIEEIWTGYTATLSRLIGDKGDWLEWYWLECQMGARPKEVIPEQGAAPIVCGDDLTALVSVITYGTQNDTTDSAARIAELERKLEDAYAAARQGVQIMDRDRRRALDAEVKSSRLLEALEGLLAAVRSNVCEGSGPAQDAACDAIYFAKGEAA